MEFFLEHYAAGFRRVTASTELRATLHALADRAADTPQRVLCHRDYHSRNLMVRDDGSLAMVDIQDARWGPDSYDLASLLRDAYVDLDEDRIEPLIDLYLACLDVAPDAGAFRERFHTVAAQRMIKALGTFGYQAGSLGRERYTEPMPRTLERLRRLLPLHAGTRDVHAALAAAGLFETP
jgi:aminoglycoside/choline kinase family phosphotransferase